MGDKAAGGAASGGRQQLFKNKGKDQDVSAIATNMVASPELKNACASSQRGSLDVQTMQFPATVPIFQYA